MDDSDDPAPEPAYDGPTMRSMLNRGKRGIIVRGRPHSGWNDAYHQLLRAPLWGLLLMLLAVFLGLNTLFAGLYMLQPGDITGARPGSFQDAFFFSVQTLGTVGYGVLTPHTLYANELATAELFLNLIFVAISTGLVFSRVSRPTARVMFSQWAVVTPYEGVPTLMFRAANQRGNQILEAEVTLNLARQVITAEGHTIRQFQELSVTRAKSPLFALSWLVMHPITESSPLYGVTAARMAAAGMEILITLSGTDDTFAQRIHARHSFLPAEVLWNKRFEDVLSVAPDGRRVIDYRRFHDVRDV